MVYFKKILKIFSLIIISLIVFVMVVIIPYILTLKKEAIEIAELSKVEDFKPYNQVIYLEYNDIPKDVINAFVSVEDRTFWKNNGISYRGIIAALYGTVIKNEDIRGASTITQQLARMIYLSREKTIERKVKEIYLAKELNKKYSKEQILEFYVNNCCFANGIFGIADASNKYFGKNISELNLAEKTYLCAIPNSPEYFNPLKDKNTALIRQEKILNDMLFLNFISEDDYNFAKNQKILIKREET